ncbi:MAG: sigma-54-dependent Fis family transcriptional regulator [Azospira oryzae]|nr:MAG: sigma-54-dependent Fis family transcriptional regulator [Azospira oryzae]PZP81432.1 MAG: sigma-54-dependent Fis family transcriptional regulator [Azospira oryzae]
MGPSQILIVDDEVGIRELLSEILEDEGYQVRLAENASQARDIRNRMRPDLVLLDIWMPDTDGITLLKEWASRGLLTMPVVMMSGHATIDTAVEATRIGAFDFLEKPIAMQKLLATVGRALQRGKSEPASPLSLLSLGRAPVIAELRRRLEQVANLRAPVLLLGPPGSPTELCARYLHRPNTPWVAPESTACLVDPSIDLLAEARDGVLFLREVGDLSRMEQKGLLLYAAKLDRYNVRLVCASSRNLAELMQQGQFDAKLYELLAAVTVPVPALKDHREDIPEIARILLSQCVEAGEVPMRSFSTAALNVLRNAEWPGDLAQLNGVVRSAAHTALTEEITAEEVERLVPRRDATSMARFPIPLDLPLREARERFEQLYFEHHIAREEGNVSRVAEKVGLERTHLYRKLKQLGIRFQGRGES